MRLTPSYGTRCIRRTSKRTSSLMQVGARVRRKVKPVLEVGATGYSPLDDGALDLEEGKGNRSLPILRAFEDQVVELVTDLGVGARVSVGEVVCTHATSRVGQKVVALYR